MTRDIPLRLPGTRWQRNYFALCAASFLVSMGFTFNMPLLPLLVAELVGGNEALAAFWSGVAFAVNPLVAAVAGPVWGRVGDRWGHHRVILLAMALMGGLFGLLAFAEMAVEVVAVRAAVGLLGSFSPLVMAAVVAITPRANSARALGLMQSLQVMGAVAGPLVAGLLADRYGLRLPYLVVTALFGLGLLTMLALYRDRPHRARQAKAKRQVSGASLLSLWPVALALFGLQFADSTFGPLMPLYLPHLGAPAGALASLIGITVSLASLGAAVGSFAAPRLRWRSAESLAQIGLLAAVAVSLPVALASAWWQLIPLRVGLGLLHGGISVLCYALIARRVAAHRQGVAMATLSSAGLAGWACGAFISGLAAGASLNAVFFANAVLFALCAAGWWLGNRQTGALAPGEAKAKVSEGRSAA